MLRISGFTTLRAEHSLWPGLLPPRAGVCQGIAHAEEMQQAECLFIETLSYPRVFTNVDDMENYKSG